MLICSYVPLSVISSS